MAIKPYNVLMFGNLGPELVRMSDLFDPDECVFELERGTVAQTNRVYYSAEIKNSTIRFFELDPQPAKDSPIPKDTYWFVDDTARFDSDQTGHYIPAETSLVIVDPKATASQTEKWGTYTLLVVESVDPITYKPNLVPFNFTGDLDSAQRAIDFQNDRMMLYFDEVGEVNNDKVYRLTPDRKLLMYGTSALKYLIKKNGRVVSTDHYPAFSPTPAAYTKYLPAAATVIDFTGYSSITDPEFVDKYAQVEGQYVEYYNSEGRRQRGVLEDTDTDKQNVIGKKVYILGVSNSPLSNVLSPEPSYLVLGDNDIKKPVEGDTYTFEVYEEDEIDGRLVHSIILSVQLTATAGTRADALHGDDQEILGFDVEYYDDATGEYVDTSDIINVPAGTTEAEICRKLRPYLRTTNGRTYIDPESELLNRSWYVYGLESLTQNVPVGYALDILIRYFPSKNQKLNSLNILDVRYEELSESELALGPSPLKLYFVKTSSDTESYALADGTGHPDSFVSGTTYYKKRTDTPWSSVVHAPTRDYINCYKKIVIKNVQSSTLRHLVPVPVWKGWVESVPEPSAQAYDFKVLDYNNTYSSPVAMELSNLKIAAPAYTEGSDNGLVLDGSECANDAAIIPVEQSIRVKYRTTEGGVFERTVHDVSLMLRTPNKSDSGVDKWIIKVDGNTFGASTSSSKRPFIEFDHTDKVYSFNSTQFPNKETLLNTFYYSLAGRDAIAPTHLRLRGVDAVEQDDGTMAIPVAMAGDDAQVALDGDSEVQAPFLAKFSQPRGMMPELTPYTDGEYKYAFEKSVSTVIPEGYSDVKGPPDGAIVGAVIVEFLVESNGEFRTLIGVPVEVRVKNFNPAVVTVE